MKPLKDELRVVFVLLVWGNVTEKHKQYLYHEAGAQYDPDASSAHGWRHTRLSVFSVEDPRKLLSWREKKAERFLKETGLQMSVSQEIFTYTGANWKKVYSREFSVVSRDS